MRFIVFLFVIVAAFNSSDSPISDTWSHIDMDSGLPDNEVRAIMRDNSGKLWLGTRNAGVAVFDVQDGSWTYFTQEDGLSSNGVLSLYQDSKGNIWTAGGAGYSLYTGGQWTHSDSLAGSSVRVAYTVSGDSEEHVWLGANGGASIYDGSQWTYFTQADGLPHRVVHALHRESGNAIWFACRQGLAHWDGQEMHVRHEEENFRAILRDPNGTIWFGTGGSGIYEYNEGEWTHHSPGKTILPAVVDRHGHLWSTTEGDGVYAYDGSTWHHYGIEDGLISDTVYSIAEASDGSIWFGTDKGVSVYMRK